MMAHETLPRRTPLYETHRRLGAAMTDFAGWAMPLRYGSETAEHNAVRSAAGLFDLSHMGEIEVAGPQAAAALNYALVSGVRRRPVPRAPPPAGSVIAGSVMAAPRTGARPPRLRAAGTGTA